MVTFERVLVTPTMARSILDKNDGNRKILDKRIASLAAEMKAGRWRNDTAEVIKISKSGRLLDGQHRLTAIVRAGVSIWMHIARNLDDAVFDVLDTGKSRNYGDVFETSGIMYCRTLPSMIMSYMQLVKGLPLKGSGYAFNSRVVLEAYNENPIFWDAIASKSTRWYDMGRLCPPSMIGGVYAVAFEISPVKAGQFMEELFAGTASSHPCIPLLRNALTKNLATSRKLSRNHLCAVMIKAWNAYSFGRPVKQLRYTPDVEPYPSMV